MRAGVCANEDAMSGEQSPELARAVARVTDATQHYAAVWMARRTTHAEGSAAFEAMNAALNAALRLAAAEGAQRALDHLADLEGWTAQDRIESEFIGAAEVELAAARAACEPLREAV